MIAPLTRRECEQIATILNRRANEIAGYKSDMARSGKDLASVDYALEREIERLRHLAERVSPAEAEQDE